MSIVRCDVIWPHAPDSNQTLVCLNSLAAQMYTAQQRYSHQNTEQIRHKYNGHGIINMCLRLAMILQGNVPFHLGTHKSLTGSTNKTQTSTQ